MNAERPWVESAAVGNDCTAGFVARRDSNGEYALVTAGHCIYVGGQGTWRHNGHDIGTTTGHTWYANSTADAAFIRMNDAGTPLPSIKNHVLRNDEGLSTITSVGDTTVQVKGGSVCRTGFGTGQLSGGSNNGRTCGVIGEVNVTHDSCINNNATCRAIRHTWEMKFDSVGGDSGGPVFAGVLDPDYGQGYGIHIHSTDGAGAISWYSPLGWVQAEFFNHFADHPSYRFCLNTSCSLRGP